MAVAFLPYRKAMFTDSLENTLFLGLLYFAYVSFPEYLYLWELLVNQTKDLTWCWCLSGYLLADSSTFTVKEEWEGHEEKRNIVLLLGAACWPGTALDVLHVPLCILYIYCCIFPTASKEVLYFLFYRSVNSIMWRLGTLPSIILQVTCGIRLMMMMMILTNAK